MIRGGMPAEVEKYIVGWKNIGLDARALTFTFSMAVRLGFWPDLHRRSKAPGHIANALKEGSRGTAGRGRHRVRAILVAAQITLAVVLLVGASLMVRGFNTLISASERFEPATLLTFRLAITATKYKTPQQRVAFYRDVMERAPRSPARGPWRPPPPCRIPIIPAARDSRSRENSASPQLARGMYQSVNAPFFETTHTRLRAGRLLETPTDRTRRESR